MSANFSAYAIIGLKLDKDLLYQEAKQVKAFEHNHPKTMKFCPNTGKECWKEVREEIQEWDGQNLCGFQVHRSTDGNELIVGIVVADGAEEYHGGVDFAKLPDNLEEQKRMLEDKLKPLGLWNKSKFGLYAVLYCSY